MRLCKFVFTVSIIIYSINAYSDITGTKKIKDNIDRKLKKVEISALTPEEKQGLLVNPVILNLNMIVPVYGSYILDTKIYGSIRPPAIIVDWTLGGIIPLSLAAISFFGREKFTSKTGKVLRYTALGLYIATRIGIFITINEHIYQYNKYMKERLNISGYIEKDSNIKIGYIYQIK